MKILVVTANYPSAARPLAAVFNERSVIALQDICEQVQVLAPRPYVPPLFSAWKLRWKSYGRIPAYEVRNGVQVYRPAYLQVSRMPGSFCIDGGAFLWCRQMAKQMHKRINFDAVLSFDLLGAGGIAWRIGRDLGIPASGWATGDDVRVQASSAQGKAVVRALNNLDLIFYQSDELLKVTAKLLSASTTQMPAHRHVVLSRGILPPLRIAKNEIRKRMRKQLGIADDQLLVLSVTRVRPSKGTFELIDAVSLASSQDPRIRCVVVGSDPAFDETASVRKKVEGVGTQRMQLLPACGSDEVWEYLCAADIFAFTSHQEGMPNGLLEAMVMEVPAVAFAIPPVVEIDAGTGAIVLVPPFDSGQLATSLLRLAASREDRSRTAETAKKRVMRGFMARENMGLAVRKLSNLVQKRSLQGQSSSSLVPRLERPFPSEKIDN